MQLMLYTLYLNISIVNSLGTAEKYSDSEVLGTVHITVHVYLNGTLDDVLIKGVIVFSARRCR